MDDPFATRIPFRAAYLIGPLITQPTGYFAFASSSVHITSHNLYVYKFTFIYPVYSFFFPHSLCISHSTFHVSAVYVCPYTRHAYPESYSLLIVRRAPPPII